MGTCSFHIPIPNPRARIGTPPAFRFASEGRADAPLLVVRGLVPRSTLSTFAGYCRQGAGQCRSVLVLA